MAEFPVRVGVVGCGNISGIYLKNAELFPTIQVVGCADLVPDRAFSRAAEFGLPGASTVDDILEDPQVEIVINLTTPRSHAGIAIAAMHAGKSVYNEKPLAVERDGGRKLLEIAQSKNLLVGCAPDTFLGAGYQTARKLLDEGAIGQPVAATAFMVCHGHESWHPDPAFYYQPGGGPLFDMGPYYLTALIHLLGPVKRLSGAARISIPERTITSEPKKGQVIKVETPTHVTGVLEFVGGAVVTLITSFDIWHANLPLVELHGTEGSLSLPDPNGFGGPVRLRRAADKEWQEVPLTFHYADNSRGLGVVDMAHALRFRRPHRANGELAFHVLDIMHALHESAETGRHIELQSTCERPAPLVEGSAPGILGD